MEFKHRLNETEEPKIFKSLRRVAEYYIRASKYITRYTNDYTEEIIYKKNIRKLPDVFKLEKNELVVLLVGKYQLQSKIDSLPDQLTLECHIGKEGEIFAVLVK